MADWRDHAVDFLQDANLHPRDGIDILVTAWLLHRRTHLPPRKAFLQRSFELGPEARLARGAAGRWFRRIEPRMTARFSDGPRPVTTPWGMVHAERQVGPGAWEVRCARGGGVLLSRQRRSLLPPEFRGQGGAFGEGASSAVVVVHFPFLTWASRDDSLGVLARALRTVRETFPRSYEALLDLPAGELGIAGRRRRADKARRLLEDVRRRGFDPERYRAAVRYDALGGNRDGVAEVARLHPRNWLCAGEEVLLTELLEFVWEDGVEGVIRGIGTG